MFEQGELGVRWSLHRRGPERRDAEAWLTELRERRRGWALEMVLTVPGWHRFAAKEGELELGWTGDGEWAVTERGVNPRYL